MDVKGKAYANAEFKLYDRGTYKPEEYVEVKKHPILELFRRPNEYQTWWEIKYKIACHFALPKGEAYLLKIRDESRFKVVRQLFLLEPDRTILNWNGNAFEYTYTSGSGVYTFPYEDVIMLKYPNPMSTMRGRGIINNILDISDVDRAQTALMRLFYERGGFMGNVFTTKNDLRNSFQRTKEQLQAMYGGVKNSFLVGLLDNGLEPIKASYSIKDMDIKPNRELTRDEVSACF